MKLNKQEEKDTINNEVVQMNKISNNNSEREMSERTPKAAAPNCEFNFWP